MNSFLRLCSFFLTLSVVGSSALSSTIPVLVGPSQTVAGQNNTYSFSPVSGASSYRCRWGKLAAYTKVEDAEDQLGGVLYQVASGANITNDLIYPDGGFHSLHLTQGNATDAWVKFNNSVAVPAGGATLTFKSRLLKASTSQSARVQVSTDDGATWPYEIFKQNGTGTGANAGETVFRDVGPISLNAFAGQNIRVRFVYRYSSAEGDRSAGFGNGDDMGWFFDDVKILGGAQTLFSEDAESGYGGFATQIPSGLEVINDRVYSQPHPHSFHLTQANIADSWLELNRVLVPQTGSLLQFKSRLRKASTSQSARVLVSVDDGATWPYQVFKQAGSGTGANAGEAVFRDVTPISLDAFAGQSIRIRFVYKYSSAEGDRTAGFGNADDMGWFFDVISISGAEELIAPTVAATPDAASAVFTATQAGAYAVQIQPIGTAPMEWGPAKKVTASASSGSGNTVPTITSISTQTIAEDTASGAIAFTVGDAETSPGSLIVTASSSVPALVPVANIVLGGSGAARSVSITPAANQSGSSVIMLSVSDGSMSTNTNFTVNVNPVNDAPVAQTGALTVTEDVAKTGTLAASDVDGDALTYEVVAQGTKGVVAITNATTGAFTYTPNGNTNGADSFTFKATDPSGTASNVATVSVTIAAVNDAPVAQNSSLAVVEDIVKSGALVAADLEGDALNYSIVTQGAKGVVTITNVATGAFTYTPNANANGSDSFTFKATDAGGATSNVATVTVGITPVNDAPVAQNKILAMAAPINPPFAPTPVQGSLIATDVDGDQLTFLIVSGATQGTVAISSTGSFVYTPSSCMACNDSFSFKVKDFPGMQSNLATVSVIVDSDNDGLPDWWEIATFGSKEAQDADEDSDGDGQTNGQEYLTGTDAASGSSTFSAIATVTPKGLRELAWPSVSGRTYTVECATNLTEGWLKVAENIPATPDYYGFTHWTDTSNQEAAQIFYRVGVRTAMN